MRLTGADAAPKIPDGSLNSAYIDARHDYASVVEDLGDWWPKIKPGGLLAGHDYVDDSNNVHGDFGVKKAVDKLAAAQGHRVISTFADAPWLSWPSSATRRHREKVRMNYPWAAESGLAKATQDW